MSGGRRWSVEAKEFELMVKAGASGVRIFERSKGKQRSIFMQKDELEVGTYRGGFDGSRRFKGLLGSIQSGLYKDYCAVLLQYTWVFPDDRGI
jgi:hypothetical protein